MNDGCGVHTLCDRSSDSCKAWAGAVMAAKMASSPITIYYSGVSATGDQSAVGGACHNIGNWVTPSDPVYYIEMN